MLSSKILNYEFGPGNTYLVVVTYGPASMALLDMMQKEGVKPIVCFVNYHFNDEIEQVEQMLRLYCQQHDLTLEVCDANFMPQEGKDDNYPLWQRNTRYAFFEQIYQKYNAAALFLSHIQDDVIESYLLTKEQGIKNAKYGVNRVATYHDMIVVRPLLEYTRDDLREYDAENNVPYSEMSVDFEKTDTSGLRKHIETLNEVERGQLLDQMRKENADKINFINDIGKDMKQVDELEIRSIMALSQDEFIETLIDYVNHKSPVHITITTKMAKDIRKLCLDPKPNMTMQLKGNVYLVKEYDVISLDTDGLDMPYSYTLDAPGKFSCDSFDLDFSMGAEDRNIHPEDYPITIRSVLPQDSFTYGGYLVPVRRMLVAAGISPRLLHVWPVFLDKNGKVIYVPRYKKGFSEYHSSVLNIHVKNDEK